MSEARGAKRGSKCAPHSLVRRQSTGLLPFVCQLDKEEIKAKQEKFGSETKDGRFGAIKYTVAQNQTMDWGDNKGRNVI